eukprot:COSAG06_NODE_11539_length_1495_cov_1.418338_3_plen_42_part_01
MNECLHGHSKLDRPKFAKQIWLLVVAAAGSAAPAPADNVVDW